MSNETQKKLNQILQIATYDCNTTSAYWGDGNLRNRQSNIINEVQWLLNESKNQERATQRLKQRVTEAERKLKNDKEEKKEKENKLKKLEEKLVLSKKQEKFLTKQLIDWRNHCRTAERAFLYSKDLLQQLGEVGTEIDAIKQLIPVNNYLQKILTDCKNRAIGSKLTNEDVQMIYALHILRKLNESNIKPITNGMERTAKHCIWYMEEAIRDQAGNGTCYAFAASELIISCYSRIVGIEVPKHETLVTYFSNRISKNGGHAQRCIRLMPIIQCSNQPVLQKRNVQLAVEGSFVNVKNRIKDRPLLFNFRLTNKHWKQLQLVSGGYRTTPITLAEFEEQEQYIDTKNINDPDITSGHAVVLLDILYKRVENDYYYYYQLKNSWGCGPGLCDDGIYYIEKALFDKYAIYAIYDVYFKISDLPDVLKTSYLNFTNVGGNYELYQFYAYRFGFGGADVLGVGEEVAYVIHQKGRISNLIWHLNALGNYGYDSYPGIENPQFEESNLLNPHTEINP